jgi:hypothetical protein
MTEKSSIITKWGIVLFLVILSSATGSTDTTTVPVAGCYDSAVQLLVNQDYASAQALCTTALRNNPSDLKSLYLSFAIEQTRILDYESYVIEEKRFRSFADSIRPVFEKRIASLHGRDSTDCLFYLANIYGGVSLMQLKTGNWFDGAKNAITLVSLLKQVKKRDSTYYAADLGLGAFNYYLSTSFKWLPFVDVSDQEMGLNLIQSALKSAPPPYNNAAKNSLCWILIDRKEFNRADSIVQTAIDSFPDNTIFLRIKALITLWTGKYDAANNFGNQLIRLSEKRIPLNWSDLVLGYTVVVQCAADQGKTAEAYTAACALLDRGIPRQYLDIPHIKKNIKYITSIKQKCKRGA